MRIYYAQSTHNNFTLDFVPILCYLPHTRTVHTTYKTILFNICAHTVLLILLLFYYDYYCYYIEYGEFYVLQNISTQHDGIVIM